jgi:hypothetical protein
MTGFPDFIGTTEQLLNALKKMLIRKDLTKTDKSVICEAVETIESLRDQIWEMSDYD